jgi:hypothetical protein
MPQKGESASADLLGHPRLERLVALATRQGASQLTRGQRHDARLLFGARDAGAVEGRDVAQHAGGGLDDRQGQDGA